jgi:hypothetical protein
MSNVININNVPNIIGAEISGNRLVVDEYVVPNARVKDRGDVIEFILGDSYSYSVPHEYSYLFASVLANAMAIGAGQNHISQYGKQYVCLSHNE